MSDESEKKDNGKIIVREKEESENAGLEDDIGGIVETHIEECLGGDDE